MIIRIGVDIESIDRVARFIEEHAMRLGDVFTLRERAFCESRFATRRSACYAAAFAAKEAVMKSLGTGWRSDIEWADIETPLSAFEPARLSGMVARVAERQGVGRITVGVTATLDTVMATAIAETN